MAFFDKLKDKTNEMLEVSKLNGKINEERGKIAANTSKIAEYYLAKFESGGELDVEPMEYCTAIKTSNDAIIVFNQEIIKIKEEPKQEPKPIPQPKPIVETPSSTDRKLYAHCTSCGELLPLGKKFCPECGAPVQSN